jgi:hypothetical protein
MDMYSNNAPANHVVEVEFKSKKVYQQPFFDVYLDVVFTALKTNNALCLLFGQEKPVG